jgi:hypothetical protein
MNILIGFLVIVTLIITFIGLSYLVGLIIYKLPFIDVLILEPKNELEILRAGRIYIIFLLLVSIFSIILGKLVKSLILNL